MELDGELELSIRAQDYELAVRLIRTIGSRLPKIEMAKHFYPSFAPESIGYILEATDEGQALYYLAAEYWDSDEWKLAAIDVFRLAIRNGSTEALVAIGDSLDWLGAYEEAIPFLERARSEGVGSPEWISGLLGHARLQLGNSSEEVEVLLREGAAKYPDFGVDYAKALRARGADDEAAAILRPLVDAGVYGAAIQLGNLLSEKFDVEGAVEAYLKGIESKDGHSAFNLAILYHKEGQEADSRYYKLVARDLGDMTEWPDE